MVKKAIIGATGLLVIAVIIQVNTTPETKGGEVINEKQLVASENETVIIEYEDASLSDEDNVTAVIDKDKEFIEAKTFDSLGRREIALINYDKKEHLNEKDTVTLYGKIDHSKFELKIPRELVYQDEGNIHLRVRNLKSGEEEMVQFEYIDMLRDDELEHAIEINSDDFSHIIYASKEKGILP